MPIRDVPRMSTSLRARGESRLADSGATRGFARGARATGFASMAYSVCDREAKWAADVVWAGGAGPRPERPRRTRHEAQPRGDRPVGYLFFPSRFTAAEAAVLRAAADEVYALDREEVWCESSGVARTAFAAHTYHEAFRRLGRHPRLIEPVMQIVDGPVYMHQYKVNAKAAFDGEVWQWHQDFGTWHRDDEMPEPRAMNIAVFLDEVTAANGPLLFLPGSHKQGVFEAGHDLETTSYPLWTLDRATVTRLAERGGCVAPTGPAGQHHRLRLDAGAREPAEHQSARPQHRVSVAVPRRQSHPPVQAGSVDRPSRFRADRAAGGRLPRRAGAVPARRPERNAMYLYDQLREHAGAGRPVRVGLIGAGKFGSMFLSQAPSAIGLEVRVIADLDPDRARAACRAVGWSDARVAATRFTDDALEAVRRRHRRRRRRGDRRPGCRHRACASRVLGGPAHRDGQRRGGRAGRAACSPPRRAEAGVVYTMAYGDQPALTCELVEWARSCGFDVVAAGKGTKYLPSYHASTPDTVWEHYGLTAEQAAGGGHEQPHVQLVPRRDEVRDRDGRHRERHRAHAASRTACGFLPAAATTWPTCCGPPGTEDSYDHKGQVEVVSSLERDGRPVPNDLRWGVYVVIEAPNDYTAALLPPVRHEHRCDRPLLGHVQAVPPHRAGAQRVDPVGRTARQADGRYPRLRRRRGGDREAGPGGGGDPRWRGRVHGLRQAAIRRGRRSNAARCLSGSRTGSY